MKFLSCFLQLLIAVQLARADLPIHGVLNDVKGTWTITLSKTKANYPAACGGGVPNLNKENLEPELENYSKWLETNGELEKAFSLHLTDKKITSNGDVTPRNKWQKLAIVEPSNPSKVVGTWTMVYDEGFEMRSKNRRFFALLKYSRKDSSFCPPELDGDNEDNFGATKCYATDPSSIHMGWYVEDETVNGLTRHRYGCFHAQKNNNDDVSPSFVIENSSKFPKILSDKFIEEHNAKSSTWIAEQQEQFANSTPKELGMAAKQLGYTKFHSSTMNYRLPQFLEKDKKESQTGLYGCLNSEVSLLKSEIQLPKFWSWGDPFITENWDPRSEDVINQGNCGSCYAVSAAYVLQKRYEAMFNKLFPHENIKAFKDFSLSPQSVLSCSQYNQGCDGGFPFLVGKHTKEIGLPTTECMSYLATHNPSEAPCKIHVGTAKRSPLNDAPGCSQDQRWYAKDYGYVGGCYECCNETHMMNEIFFHGPVVVAIDAPDQLFLYRDGVFDTSPSEHGKICDDPGKNLNGWEYTNHAVAVVGWGEQESKSNSDNPTKYWIVRNTWGKDWGKHGTFLLLFYASSERVATITSNINYSGYMKVPRGTNFAGIESQAVYIDPDLSKGYPKLFLEKIQQRIKSRTVSDKPSLQSISEHSQILVSQQNFKI